MRRSTSRGPSPQQPTLRPASSPRPNHIKRRDRLGGLIHEDRLAARKPHFRTPHAYEKLRLIHLSSHATWLNQIELYFFIVQRKALTPKDFDSLAERLLPVGDHYQRITEPFDWTFTSIDLDRLLARLETHKRGLALAAGRIELAGRVYETAGRPSTPRNSRVTKASVIAEMPRVRAATPTQTTSRIVLWPKSPAAQNPIRISAIPTRN
jgi:hypothetical protein